MQEDSKKGILSSDLQDVSQEGHEIVQRNQSRSRSSGGQSSKIDDPLRWFWKHTNSVAIWAPNDEDLARTALWTQYCMRYDGASGSSIL